MFQQYQNIIIPVLLAFVLIFIFWNLILQISLSKIKKSQRMMFQGKKAKDLESIITDNQQNIEKTKQDIEKLYELTSKNNYLASKSLYKTGMIRFNPFRDIGGDQSFSLSLLDKDNNGVVISSLYSREGVRVYAKSIQDGKSGKYPLTEEEKQAIAISSIEKNNLKNKKAV